MAVGYLVEHLLFRTKPCGQKTAIVWLHVAPFYAFDVRVDYPRKLIFSGVVLPKLALITTKELFILILFKASVQWCSGQHALRRHSGKCPAIAREVPGSTPG